MKYAFMLAHVAEFSVSGMCRVFEVSRSGFYDWQASSEQRKQRAAKQATLDSVVKETFFLFKMRYGVRRLYRELKAQGYDYYKEGIAASLKRQGLVAKAARKFKATTYSKHKLPVATNILEQDFTATAPNQKWVTDITYLWTTEGWLYLAIVVDLYSRLVVGWAMNERMTTALISDALQMALWQRKHPKGVIVHSDRGSQYCSHDYQALLKKHKLICSMSAKGNCYDNACAETFFHSLKVEAIHGEQLLNREQTKSRVFEYMAVDYNNQRRHSYTGYLSPADFEKQQKFA